MNFANIQTARFFNRNIKKVLKPIKDFRTFKSFLQKHRNDPDIPQTQIN